MDSLLIATLSVLLLGVFFISFARKRWNRLPSPPGPPGLPIIGHVLVNPKERPWEQYHLWSKQLNSDIIELNMLGMRVVILDSMKAVNDLLEKRSLIYSSRPHMPMLELMGWEFMFGVMPYGPRWRAHRKMFDNSFNPIASTLYEPHELKASRRLLLDLLNEPQDFLDHFRKMAGSTIMSIAYGIETKSRDDPYIKLSDDAVNPVLESLVPGTYWVDMIPVMKFIPDWMPFAKFKQVARQSRKLARDMVEVPFEATLRMIANGDCPPSFVSEHLQNIEGRDDEDEQREVIKNTAATMYFGAAENIIGTLAGFVLAMLSNPEAQRIAQDELDAVLAPGSLPAFTDRSSLPYVTALTIEVFRWSISSPLGGVHVLEVDDEYKGYQLRAGTWVFGNVWSTLHDEEKYPDPFSFKPERFIRDGKLIADSREVVAAFGFGRRICPGRHMAFSSVWITIASIIAAYNISKAADEDGVCIEPALSYSKSSSCLPAPFNCQIKPRTHHVEAMIFSASE